MKSILFFLLLYVSHSSLMAQSLEISDDGSFDLNGYVRGMAFVGGETAGQSILMSEMSLKGNMDYHQTFLHSDIRFRFGEALGRDLDRIQVKELYAGYKGEKLDILFGDQILVWGRTDGFSPNDYFSSSDYFFLTPESDDQRLPALSLRANYRITPTLDLEVVAQPLYRHSVYRYDLFDMGANVHFSEVQIPTKNYKNGSLAGRMSVELPSIGFSVYGFYGYDPFYGFGIDTVDWATGNPEIYYAPSPYHLTAFGADFDMALGNILCRGDFSYQGTKDYTDQMNIPNPELDYVLALEYNTASISILGQYIGKYVMDFAEQDVPQMMDPANPLAQWTYAGELINYESASFNRKIFNQQKELNHALSLVARGQLFYNTLSIEVAGYYNLTSEEYLLRPKLDWHVRDQLIFSLGCSVMGGPDQSVFDYSGSVMNGIFTEIKATF